MSNRRNIQFTYNPHNKLTLLDCNFIVDSTNGNGFGVRSLDRGGRIAYVYMNTSASPATGNPNPEAGIILVQLQDNYNDYRFGGAGFVAPLSGTPISISGSSVLTLGVPYTIVSLGTSTQANWVAMGLPANINAAVGVPFIATATGSGSGTGQVEALGTGGSGIDHIEVVGDTILTQANGVIIPTATTIPANGLQFILACYKNGVLTAPNNGTVIGLSFGMNDSAQGV
jgi:hypothetical protein